MYGTMLGKRDRLLQQNEKSFEERKLISKPTLWMTMCCIYKFIKSISGFPSVCFFFFTWFKKKPEKKKKKLNLKMRTTAYKDL